MASTHPRCYIKEISRMHLLRCFPTLTTPWLAVQDHPSGAFITDKIIYPQKNWFIEWSVKFSRSLLVYTTFSIRWKEINFVFYPIRQRIMGDDLKITCTILHRMALGPQWWTWVQSWRNMRWNTTSIFPGRGTWRRSWRQFYAAQSPSTWRNHQGHPDTGCIMNSRRWVNKILCHTLS